MFLLPALVLAPAITFERPRPWALGFADKPNIALVGDPDHSGYASLLAVSPSEDGSITVDPSVDGYKAGGGFQAIAHWGKGCQAAAAGEIDDVPGTDVVGIFGGKTLRLAGAFANGKFTDTPTWATLPRELSSPGLAVLDGGKTVLAFSTRDGSAYLVDSKGRTAIPCRVPGDTAWIGDAGSQLVGQDGEGNLFWMDRQAFQRGRPLGSESKNSRPAAMPDLVVFQGKYWTPRGLSDLPPSDLPPSEAVFGVGQMDKDGTLGVFEYRYGKEPHTGSEITLRRQNQPGERSAFTKDSSKDGLLDGWKIYGFRGLDLKSLGCKPGQADILCLISRFDSVKEDRVKSEMQRVVQFYADLKVQNPDGSRGIHFHPIYLPPITGDDQKSSWETNRDKFLPSKWRGIVHWMQITPGGGGQADELSDGGTCGEGALWAVFVHEFGHQMGLDHTGFWPLDQCPIYTSLMNYNYSYQYEGDRNKIHYSDGSLYKIVLNEADLDETLPYPYEKVKFLEGAPYHFHLKPNGATTLVDWNWNGIFGEKHVRADIKYAYATTAGTRDPIDKAKTAPWLFVHDGQGYDIFGTNDKASDPKTDPSLSAANTGRLMLKHMKGPYSWDPAWTVEEGGVIGDPVAWSYSGRIFAAYQTERGVVLRQIQIRNQDLNMTAPTLLSEDKTLVPTLGDYGGRLYVFLWNPATNVVQYRVVDKDGKPSVPFELDTQSTNPVGLCTDTVSGQAVVGLALDQDVQKTHRWQIRHYQATDEGKLVASGPPEWVEGETGGARGTGRITLLFAVNKDTGPAGRIYFFCKGMTDANTPWACTYVAQQIADKSVHGGWLTKRFYDEWSQTRSAPAAAWYKDDIMFAFRWVDGGQGSTDNIQDVAWQGLGIQNLSMGDFDDLSFIRDFGIEASILNLGKS